jgi:hypothetical protein
MKIFDYFNIHKKIPDSVDCSQMYSIYKSDQNENLHHLFFKQNDMDIEFNGEIVYETDAYELQFSNYKFIPFSKFRPFIEKYFYFNDIVIHAADQLKNKYNIDFENTCGVFYRGNDKVKETQKPPYHEVVEQAVIVKNENPTIQFIVQTDEYEFLQYFLQHFPDAVFFSEIPVIDNQITTVAYYFMNSSQKFNNILFYLASIYIFSKLKKLITTSGNGEMFIMFYRNNADGLVQYLKLNEYIHGFKNNRFDPNQNIFWI